MTGNLRYAPSEACADNVNLEPVIEYIIYVCHYMIIQCSCSVQKASFVNVSHYYLELPELARFILPRIYCVLSIDWYVCRCLTFLRLILRYFGVTVCSIFIYSFISAFFVRFY